MSQVIGKVQTVLPQAFAFKQAASIFRSQLPVWGTVTVNQRQYRGAPTQGIGRWKYLLPQEGPKKRKETVQMKAIVAAADTAYGTLNVKVSGYDMTIVEHYSQYIHRCCNRFSIKISESYALPTKTTEVLLMPDQGTKMLVNAVLKTHERVIQVSSLNASLCPVFLDVLLKNQPEGVELSITEHSEEDFKARFKARPELLGLKEQLRY